MIPERHLDIISGSLGEHTDIGVGLVLLFIVLLFIVHSPPTRSSRNGYSSSLAVLRDFGRSEDIRLASRSSLDGGGYVGKRWGGNI